MDVVTKKYNVNGLLKTYFYNSKTRKDPPRNVPKELFTWAPPKTTAWIKEYQDKHQKPPIYKIKLKYLEHYILPVNGPYYVKGYPMYSPESRSAQAQSEDIPNGRVPLITRYDGGPGDVSSRTSFCFSASTSSSTFFRIIPSVSFVKDAEYLWEELITSIRKTGQRTPIRVHQQVNDNGEIHWRVLNGNHRCNALLDIYGPDHEVDCWLLWTREKPKPISKDIWENRYLKQTNAHMKIKNHVNIHRPATKEDNLLFREKINEGIRGRIHSVTGHTLYNSHNKVNKTYKDYL